MNELVQAVVARLKADAGLTAMLGRYLGSPSIFGAPPVAPAHLDEVDRDAAFPQIVFEGVTSDEPFDTKTSRGRDVTFDISAYSLVSESVVEVNAVAEAMRKILDSHLPVAGFATVLTQVVAGPIPQDGDFTQGRTISVRVIMEV